MTYVIRPASEVMCYRAFCRHGVVRAMVVDEPATKDLVCESLAEWPRWAAHIDHVTIEESRKSNMVCAQCDPKLAAAQADLFAKAEGGPR